MSSLGMNDKGEVRTASEFKSIFDDTGASFRPYRCPFCEILYEDRCIITDCVKAPHFKLPVNATHLNGCNGESGETEATSLEVRAATVKKTVVGKIEIPEALVKRRKASTVRRPGDNGLGPTPDTVEVTRRRKLIAGDRTISSCFTTSQLRPIIQAYKRLRKHAYDQAVAAKLTKGTAEYNACFRETLAAHGLSLYGQKLTYGNAFLSFKLQPNRSERIYSGSGEIRVEGNHLVIRDSGLWPVQPKSKTDLAAFEVWLNLTLPTDTSTSHLRAMEELELLAKTNANIEWHAYGLPVLNGEQFTLLVKSLDDFYWAGQHKQ